MANWKSPQDLRNAAQNLEAQLERNAERQGQEAAERLVQASRNGGGIWLIIRIPVVIVAGVMLGSTLWQLTGKVMGDMGMFILWFVAGIGWSATVSKRLHPIVELILAPVVIFGLMQVLRLN